MKKTIAFILLLTFTLLFDGTFFARSTASFNGSRTGNESQLILDFKLLNTTDSQNLELSAGDMLKFEVVAESGSIDIRLQEASGGKVLYEGTDIPTSIFQSSIEESGSYTVFVTGRKASGSVHIVAHRDV